MTQPPFVDAASVDTRSAELWEPLIISGDEIDAEIARLADGERDEHGRRESLIVHPRSAAPGLGLTPGIEVRLSVLRPGESTEPRRHNATEVSFCISGSGETEIAGKVHSWSRYDVWNHPAWSSHVHHNRSDEVSVRLTYSNSALLQRLRVHLVDEQPPPPDGPSGVVEHTATEIPDERRSPFGTFELADGAWMMPYELLISPPSVASPSLFWGWDDVRSHLDQLAALGDSYRGRRLYLLYNPKTERTNGTTPSFFATMTIRPPGIVDRPHRHVSAAINYYFRGSGWSRVAGRRYEWKAGDLMFSAPGWAVHNHASDDGEPVYELTVQDQPLHLAMESLLWQEDLKHEAVLLGAHSGFATNREEVSA